jgi:hypothetical protein
LPRDLLVDVTPDRHVLGERASHRVALDGPAAERHDRRRPADLPCQGVQSRDDQALLAAPELSLSLALEEGTDRLAQLAFEQIVGVDHAEPESLGHGLGRAGLARGHEPDEDDPVVRAHLRHPMRSLYAASAARTSSMWSPPNFSR